jgi:hypothetical protein
MKFHDLNDSDKSKGSSNVTMITSHMIIICPTLIIKHMGSFTNSAPSIKTNYTNFMLNNCGHRCEVFVNFHFTHCSKVSMHVFNQCPQYSLHRLCVYIYIC